MGKIFVLAITMGLLVLPSVNYGQPEQAASEAPPIAQPLVREGDFAMRLAEVLSIGSPASEPEAESMLSAVGIAPENGWIADYPVTPVTISELRSAVARAAGSNRLPMTRDEALGAFENLIGELGLSVASETSGEQGSGEPPKDYPDYVGPGIVNDYYYDQGPPVVTYYCPPPHYYYLYSWVPYPFWYSRFFFGGFFILRDFNKVIIVNRRKAVVSNHVFHRKSRRYYALGPDRRFRRHRGVSSFRAKGKIHQGRGFRSAGDRKGAQSILNRSFRRNPTHPGPPARGSFKPRGTLGRGSSAGMLIPESRGRRRNTGESASALERRLGRSGRSSILNRGGNLGTRREKARIRRGGTFVSRRSLRTQERSGAHRAFNASPRGGPTRKFSRGSAGRRSRGGRAFSRGFIGRSRRAGFSVK
jgi:hypothetical protein